MKKYHILVVEDDFINAQFIQKAIIKLGHIVVARVKSAEEALKRVKESVIHIIFMDINLETAIDGIECARLINKDYNIPIIYTTAYGDSQTIQEATETNLFGFLIKPFDFADIEAVLSLTIKQYSLLEKSKEEDDFTPLAQNYRYNKKTQTLLKEGQHIEFTPKEILLFEALFNNRNHHVSNEYLIEKAWQGKEVSASTIRNSIKRLRNKIPDIEIKSLSGIGYMLRDCP